MNIADQIEDQQESFQLKYECFLLAHSDISDEKLAIIREFTNWCLDDYENDLDSPRNPDGKSFRERRDENPT